MNPNSGAKLHVYFIGHFQKKSGDEMNQMSITQHFSTNEKATPDPAAHANTLQKWRIFGTYVANTLHKVFVAEHKKNKYIPKQEETLTCLKLKLK